jgi:hypothetical protein
MFSSTVATSKLPFKLYLRRKEGPDLISVLNHTVKNVIAHTSF